MTISPLRTVQLWSRRVRLIQIQRSASFADRKTGSESDLQQHPAGRHQRQHDRPVRLRRLCQWEWLGATGHPWDRRALNEDFLRRWERAQPYWNFPWGKDPLLGVSYTPHHYGNKKHRSEDCGRWWGHSRRDSVAGTEEWNWGNTLFAFHYLLLFCVHSGDPDVPLGGPADSGALLWRISAQRLVGHHCRPLSDEWKRR